MQKKTKKGQKTAQKSATIALNRKARHNYIIEDKFEAGLALQGWEVKSIRAGKAQLAESHVIIKKGEAWLLNAHISPLKTTSTHFEVDPKRTRKLLLNHREIKKLIGFVEQKGQTIVPLALYWKKNRVKLEIATAIGKKLYDKRATEKARDWQRQKERIMKK